MSRIDPVTLEVVRNYLQSLSDSMYTTIWRTAYSTIVRDSRDCSSALFDPKGRLVAQSDSIASLLGSMHFSIKEILKNHISPEEMEEGDVVIINDPYTHNPHTPDITLFTPIFFEEELVGFSGSIAHLFWGGMRGRRSGGRVTILNEGLRLTPMKLIERGKLNETLMKIIHANLGRPVEAMGDIRAEIAANMMGVRGMKELFGKYGKETVFACEDALMDYTEKRVRTELDKIPDGDYHALGYLDRQGEPPYPQDPVKIECNITVKGSNIHYDFTGSSDQNLTGMNCIICAGASICYYVTRCISDPLCPENEGAHRPVSWYFPPGSIFGPIYPQGVAGKHSIAQRACDTLLQAFVDILPEKVNAGSAGATRYQTISFEGYEYQTYHDMTGGGFGARHEKDGIDGIQVHMSRCVGYPIEVAETILPVFYNRWELVQDSGGAGKYRGGLALRRDVTYMFDKPNPFGGPGDEGILSPPRGAHGGKDGTTGLSYLNIGTPKEITPFRTGIINKGDVHTLITRGSGGWGDPLERDLQSVLEDVLDEKVSLKSAGMDYGVVIDPVSLTLNTEDTMRLRKLLSEKREKEAMQLLESEASHQNQQHAT